MTDLLGEPLHARTPAGKIPEWADRYGYSTQAIEKFIQRGRQSGKYPPFDHPEEMLAWGEAVLPKVTRRFEKAVELALGTAATSAPVPAADATPFEIPEIDASEMGMEHQLASYQREFVMIGKMRDQALRDSDFAKANAYLEQRNKISGEIRQLERLLPQILEQRGDYMRAAAVRSSTVEFLTVLKRSLLGRSGKAAERLRNATESDTALAKAWRDEINEVFRDVCTSKFSEAATS